MPNRFWKVVLTGIVLVFLGAGTAGAQGFGSLLTLPHIANGSQGNGVWQTRFEFVNTSGATAQGTLRLFDDTGEDLVLGTDQETDNNFNITIPPGGTFALETDGSGELVTGWAFATFDHAVAGSALFFFSTPGQGQVVSVGVPDAPTFSAFLTPAQGRTGIALANPFDLDQNLVLEARDPNGSVVATTELLLAAGAHTSDIVSDLFPELGLDFTGSVKIRSDLFFSALAIGFVPNELFDVGFNVPSFGFDELAASYSGDFESGGDTGIISLSGVEPLNSNMVTGELTMEIRPLGPVLTGPFQASVDDFGLAYAFYFLLQGRSDRGLALAELVDAIFVGTIVDDGEGNLGSFVMDPTDVSMTQNTLPALTRPARPKKNELPRWGNPLRLN